MNNYTIERRSPEQIVADAVAHERARAMQIIDICNAAGRPERADQYIMNGAEPHEVRLALMDGRGDSPDPTNQKYRDEYAEQRDTYMRIGVTEEQYIASRRVTDGLDTIHGEPLI